MDESPWPILMSISLFSNMSFFLGSLNNLSSSYYFMVSLFYSFMVFYGWSRDIVKEGLLEGSHTLSVQNGLKMGMILFIVSEIFFFISFFWTLFHVSLSSYVDTGGWPPKGIDSVNPMGVPFLGTLILISSGISVTWSHHSVMEGKSLMESMYSLSITVTLGIIFTFLQIAEFIECSFSINDSVFGSVFFMTTGFHGFHVIIGTCFLMVCLVRMDKGQFTKFHHVGYESAIWYWHFVDVVWLFLYVCLYWWSYQ